MDPVSVTAETETIRPCSGLLLDTSGVSSSIRISSMEQWRFNLLPVSTLTEEAASALCRLSRDELTMTMELAGFFAGSRNTTGSALGNFSLDATRGGAFGSSALGSAADATRRFSRELRAGSSWMCSYW